MAHDTSFTNQTFKVVGTRPARPDGVDTQILEIPNPNHPYGVRGVGETSIVPPLAAVANAVCNAAGVRMTHVPMSPVRILAAITAKERAISKLIH